MTKEVVRKRKVAVIPDIIGPRLPDLFEIDEEEFEKVLKNSFAFIQTA